MARRPLPVQASPVRGGSSDLVRQMLAQNLLAQQGNPIETPLELAGNVAQQGALAFTEAMQAKRKAAAEAGLAQRLSSALGEGQGQGMDLAKALLSDPLTRTEGVKLAMGLLTKEPPERRILKGAGGFQRFVDTGERVFPDAVAPEKPAAKTKAVFDNIAKRETFASDAQIAAEPNRFTPVDKAPLVTVENQFPQTGAFRKELGKLDAQRLGKFRNESDDAQFTLGLLDQMESLLNATQTGVFEPTKAVASRILRGFGVDPESVEGFQNAANPQTLAALTIKATLENTKVLKGAISDREIALIQQTVAGLGLEPEANAEILANARAQAQFQVDRKNAAELHIANEVEAGREPSLVGFKAPKAPKTPQQQRRRLGQAQKDRGRSFDFRQASDNEFGEIDPGTLKGAELDAYLEEVQRRLNKALTNAP